MKWFFKHKVLISCICLSLSLIMIFNLAACGAIKTTSDKTDLSGSNTQQDTDKEQKTEDIKPLIATELSKGYTRKATNEGQVTEEFKLALAEFSMSLFRGVITKDKENELVSPLSAVLCLAMLANGADGNTKKQMEDAFGMDIDTLNECLYAYTNSLYSSRDSKVNLANSIWFRDNENMLQVNEDFLQTNADWYDAQVYAAPFDASTLEDINNWCKEQTDGMIDKIVEEIKDTALMYLINALLFDAKWEQTYHEEDILDYTFKNYDASQATVKMLSSQEYLYISGEGATGFAKHYAGNKYSIVGLLPDEDTDIYDFIASLNGEKLLSLWNHKKSEIVNVKMPEFSYETDMKLNDTLIGLGMTDMFNSGLADFGKLGSSPLGNLYCYLVQQKTRIEVTREGTKAAAVTKEEVHFEKGKEPIEYYVTLNRPFVYAIVDNATGLPLFIGAVTNLG